MYAEAITEYKKALLLGGKPGEIRGLLGYAYAVSGNRTDAEKTIAELKALWPGHTHAALDLAVVFSGLGDKENTLYWLEKAQEMHVSDLIAIGQDSHFLGLRVIDDFKTLCSGWAHPSKSSACLPSCLTWRGEITLYINDQHPPSFTSCKHLVTNK